MSLTLLCSFATVLAFIEAPPTPTPPLEGRSFDELLDAFGVIETKRIAVVHNATQLAADRKSEMTVKFLRVIGEASDVLVNMRRFFDAGRVLFNFKKDKSTPKEKEDAIAKTQLLRKDNYMNNQLRRLTVIHKILEKQMSGVPRAECILVQPVMDILEQSEQAVAPLMKKF
nr:PREDICTED: uncharacterized protein LOC109030358 [Bemisia tabaci]